MSSVLPPNEASPNTASPETDEVTATETGAESPAEEASEGYVALKYTFITSKQVGDLCGAFCLIFEGATGKTLFQAFWVTHAESLADLSSSLDWRTFNKLSSHIGPYDKIWGDKLAPLIPELLPTEDRMELYRAEPQEAAQILSRISEAIRKGYERVSHFLLDVSCDMERPSRDELIEAGLLETPKESGGSSEETTAKEGQRSFSGILVQCLPLIDPIHGKALADLVPGDVLEVQIQSTVGAGGLVQQFLQATKQPTAFPIESIDRREEKTYVYLTINEEMRGLLTLNKDLRLRTLLAATDRRRRIGFFDNLIFFLFLGLVLVGFFWAIRSLF